MSERQHCKCSSCGDTRECALVGAEGDEGWVSSWQCEGCVRGMLDGFGEADTIARLTSERDEARAENADLRTTVERLTRELHRLTHGEDIEGDGVCEHEVEATHLRRDLAAETATRAALRTQESRIMGILADAGVPVGDVVEGVEAVVAERNAALAQASAMHRRAQAAEGQLGRVERLRESHAVEVGRLISRRRWDVSLWRGRYQRARAWSRLWHREARRLFTSARCAHCNVPAWTHPCLCDECLSK